MFSLAPVEALLSSRATLAQKGLALESLALVRFWKAVILEPMAAALIESDFLEKIARLVENGKTEDFCKVHIHHNAYERIGKESR